MIQTTTLLCETATVAGATGSTAKTAVKYEVDEDGNKTAILVNKKRALIGTSLGSTATSGTYGCQQHNLNIITSGVSNAQAYVESLDDKRLAELAEMLDEKQLTLESSEQVALGEIESKQPYVKK